VTSFATPSCPFSITYFLNTTQQHTSPITRIATMASGAGILWVSSKILSPDKLSESDFDAWYENVRTDSTLPRLKSNKKPPGPRPHRPRSPRRPLRNPLQSPLPSQKRLPTPHHLRTAQSELHNRPGLPRRPKPNPLPNRERKNLCARSLRYQVLRRAAHARPTASVA
jgi:hypothetical protein